MSMNFLLDAAYIDNTYTWKKIVWIHLCLHHHSNFSPHLLLQWSLRIQFSEGVVLHMMDGTWCSLRNKGWRLENRTCSADICKHYWKGGDRDNRKKWCGLGSHRQSCGGSTSWFYSRGTSCASWGRRYIQHGHKINIVILWCYDALTFNFKIIVT